MYGLSAKARSGHTLDQLLATARLAALALAHRLPAARPDTNGDLLP
jgi:TetR/AcrR family transcriptional repressor for divergent bdcA